MKIEIETGVPVPENKFIRVSKYPYADMKPGDSFFVRKSVNTMRSSSYAYGKRNKMKFTVRSEDTGARVWRLA